MAPRPASIRPPPTVEPTVLSPDGATVETTADTVRAGQLADCRDDRARNQLWTMKPDGSVQLGGRCLDVLGASSDAGAAIQLTTCNTTPAQRFTLDGDQHLVNAHSGMCLGAVGQSTASGALIEQRSCGAGTDHLRWIRR
ncbi:RICIN domain-containing protein [Micromonospora zamorensis]|uniref:RICIN domain-containing protein n=1 Tax=Micromonospora zamorensis TaxID=709883 RepID=A0ABZ1PJ67_9ACTN